MIRLREWSDALDTGSSGVLIRTHLDYRIGAAAYTASVAGGIWKEIFSVCRCMTKAM